MWKTGISSLMNPAGRRASNSCPYVFVAAQRALVGDHACVGASNGRGVQIRSQANHAHTSRRTKMPSALGEGLVAGLALGRLVRDSLRKQESSSINSYYVH